MHKHKCVLKIYPCPITKRKKPKKMHARKKKDLEPKNMDKEEKRTEQK
jgi:hypothetical protein